ncbi:MAG: hypothetical protein HDR23_06610 [Lachnospiraceae bacterium]|nr:hypothetical protein [Lachnospiraceae bacterium]
MNKKVIISVIALLIAIVILGAVLYPTRKKSYEVKITIPAGSSETVVYSDMEISPKKNKLTIYSGEGLGDCEIVLEPIEVREENAYDETIYITKGMPVKMNVEKGAWFKIGVNIQNPADEDIVVYVIVEDVDLRIA